MDSNATTFKGEYDYLVIGAGPAGIQMGYYLEKAGSSYLLLEGGDGPGTFFKKFPRHRKLISINKVYTGSDDREVNLRFDWNSLLSDSDEMLFKNYTKSFFPDPDTLTQYLADFVKHFDIKVKCGTNVVKISRDKLFNVEDSEGNVYAGKRLIVATGVTKLYVPPIPGIETAELYTDMSVDPEDFVNQRVLIIGKGNSGFETADNLVETAAVIHLTSPSPLKLAWKTHFVGHLRAVNNNLLDTYLLKSQNGLIDGKIESIEKVDGKYRVLIDFTRAQGGKGEYVYDRVIACTGFRFDDSIFDETCRPRLTINNRFPEQTSEWESTNVEDMYFAGTLMQMRDFKKTTSGFIHGFRYNIKALHDILRLKYHNKPLPSEPVPAEPRQIAAAILKRLNSTSALWQQNGFLCDVIAIDGGPEAKYYMGLPVEYLRDSGFISDGVKCMVTLEYGPDYPDYPFDFVRFIGAEEAHLNPQLHPVIRLFKDGRIAAEHHVLEDLEARWYAEVYTRPLFDFLENNLGKAAHAG